jgi:hypothetical protein
MVERREWQEREDEEVRLRWQEREDDPRAREQVDEARARFLRRLWGELDELRHVERERAEARARSDANRRFEWEQRVEQNLNALLAATGAMTATEAADTTAASAVNLKDHERIARKLFKAFPPLGIVPHHGRGHWKEANRWLKANGEETSRTVYFDALKHIRENLARTASGQS